MTNNDGTNEKSFETGWRTDGFNNDSSWLNIIILLTLLAIFPEPGGKKTNWIEVIKNTAKAIEEFEKAEEVKTDED